MRAALIPVLIALAASAARAEDVYGGVGPATYCLWNRSGLPSAQQRICAGRDKEAKAPNWMKLEAANGAVFQVDSNSVYRFPNGTAEIVVYASEGTVYIPENMRRMWFDCQGHYRDRAGAQTLYAPPRSVIGRISEMACR